MSLYFPCSIKKVKNEIEVKTSNTLVNRPAKFVRLGFDVEVLF
jgi:hypothetical protein